MPEIIATGGASEDDLRENPLKALWEKFQSLDRFSKTLVMTTVLFLVFASAITTVTLSLRNYAGGGEGIARVDVHPGVLSLLVGQKEALSTLAYDYNGNPVFSGVVYEWSMSSTNSVATLSRTISDISEITALNIGCGQLTVIARDGIQTVTRSLPIVVSSSPNAVPACANATPTPRVNPVGMSTPDVDLNAGNFYISFYGGQEFFGTKPMELHSNVGAPYPSTTTLESIWRENGVEMRMFMYFRVNQSNPSIWEMYELRTYNAQNPGEWTYYKPVDSLYGTPISAELGKPYISKSVVFRSVEGYFPSSVTFEDLKLFPFKNYKPSITPTKALTPTPTPPFSNSLELKPVADAYIRSDYPNKSYGAGKALRVDGRPKVNTYLKFDLRQLAGRKITGAKLGLYVLDTKGAASSGNQSLRYVTNKAWTENAITYKNAPNTSSVFATHSNAKRNTFIYFDITNWVLVNQGKFASLALLTGSSNEAVFGAREQANASLRPTLIIYYETNPTPTKYVTPTYYSTPTPTSIYPTRTPTP